MSVVAAQEARADAKDAALRQDIHRLGTLLGEVLQEQEGAAFFAQVETVRRLALQQRQQTEPAAATPTNTLLATTLQQLQVPTMLALVRAFAAYFEVVNLAERVHRIRRRRSYLRHAVAPQPGGMLAVLQQLRDAGLTATALQALLQDLSIVPVFTAHPTQATPRVLLYKEQRMARALVDLLAAEPLPQAVQHSMARLRYEMSLVWQSEELTAQPSVADEVEHVVFYLTDVIYRIVPLFYEGLDAAMQAVYQTPLQPLTQPIVRFGSWVGGDMDGNPNVGPATLEATLQRHRQLILNCYASELRALYNDLSQASSRVPISAALQQRLTQLQQQGRSNAADANMPYRQLLGCMLQSVQASQTPLDSTPASPPLRYANPAAMQDDINLMLDSLQAHAGAHAGVFKLQRLRWRLRTFGFHLASLDIRQDAWVHRRAVAQMTAPAGAPQADLERCLAVLHSLKRCQQHYGAAALGPYIISMCQGPEDVQALLQLAQLAAWHDAQQHVPLDIAPLFETVPDLQNAAACLRRMLQDTAYRAHLRARHNVQYVMLGYSDSNKESGIVASRWALQLAQHELVAVAAEAGIQLILFHGRGGSVSRGGSRPRHAILAEPPLAIQGQLRLTEQGEMIDAKYGLRDIALRTLELMGGAVLEASYANQGRLQLASVAGAAAPAWLPAKAAEVMQCMAAASRQAYRALVVEEPHFMAYFQAVTPLDVISRLAIGSRPVARRELRGLTDLRAIPWVFAWTQNRQMLPGWLGMAAGLSAASDNFGWQVLQDLYQQWPFFTNLIYDTAVVLASADMHMGARYAALAPSEAVHIWPSVQHAFQQTSALICRVQQTASLLEQHPVLQNAIMRRNPYIDPMSLLQIDLLQRWRRTNRQDEALERVLLTTVKGIARGLQNTG